MNNICILCFAQPTVHLSLCPIGSKCSTWSMKHLPAGKVTATQTLSANLPTLQADVAQYVTQCYTC